MEKEQLRRELLDREANLAAYELFFKNMDFGFGLQEIIEKKMKGKEKLRVFDLGCGKAIALRELKAVFGEKLYTIGLDAVKEENHGIDEFIQGDALQKSFPEDCDVVISFRAMHEIGSIKKILEKAEKCLSNKGEAFLSIRCQEFRETGIANLGRMKKDDIEFLLEILEKERFGGLKVRGKAVPVVLEGVFMDKKTGQKRVGMLQYIAGINLWLTKQ